MRAREQVGKLAAELEQAETQAEKIAPAAVVSAVSGALVAPGPRLEEVWVYSRAGAPLDYSLQVKTVL